MSIFSLAPDLLDHPFWRYSLSVYGSAGVPEELLALQDAYGLDVNVVLFCLWLGRRAGVRLDDDQLDAIAEGVSGYHCETVVPLRGVRRYLKADGAGGALAKSTNTLRTEVKRLELSAEQIEQAMLYQWFEASRFSAAAGGMDLGEANLTSFMRRADKDWDLARSRSAFAKTLEAMERVGD